MPFTFAHPAAVLPFAKSRLLLSALIIGSMMPDLPYFIQLKPVSHFGHTPLGILLLDIPAGLVFLYLLHNILKKPMLALLPQAHSRIIEKYSTSFNFSPLKNFSIIVVSLTLGILTHILWDSFTHADGLAVVNINLLQKSVAGFGIYKYLQHGSTLAGAFFILAAYINWYKKQSIVSIKNSGVKSNAIYVPIVLFLIVFILAACYSLSVIELNSISDLRYFIGRFVISSISSLFVILLGYSLVWHSSSYLKKEQISD